MRKVFFIILLLIAGILLIFYIRSSQKPPPPLSEKEGATRYLSEEDLNKIEKLCEEIEKNPTDKNNFIERATAMINLSEYLVKQGVQVTSIMPSRELIGEIKETKDIQKAGELFDKTIKELCQTAQEPIIIGRSIFVDFSKEIGKIRPLLNLNAGPIQTKADPKTMKVMYLDYSNQYQELGISSVRTHDVNTNLDIKAQRMKGGCDMSDIFPDYSKDPNKKESYNFESCDKYIKSIKEIGAEVFFRIGESWGRDEDRYSPPADFDKFATAAANIVQHYNQGWANGFKYNIQYWEIWNEPGGAKFWYGGTPQQFFELFEKTSRAIKAVDNSLKVGGPANTPNDTLSITWGYNFLKYVKENNVPLDFYSWHWYTSRPLETLKAAREVRQMLNKVGLGNVESILSEWNESEFLPSASGTKRRPNHREFFSTPFNAAYTAAVLLHLQDSDVVFAHHYRGDGQNMGIFEYDGSYRKPAYAYKALKQFFNYPIRLELKGLEELPEGFTAIAGASKDKKFFAILISDYRESENPYQLTLLNFPFAKNQFTIERYVLNEEKNLELIESKKMDGKEKITLEHKLQGPAVELLIFK